MGNSNIPRLTGLVAWTTGDMETATVGPLPQGAWETGE
jgi:hypothetical protein